MGMKADGCDSMARNLFSMELVVIVLASNRLIDFATKDRLRVYGLNVGVMGNNWREIRHNAIANDYN